MVYQAFAWLRTGQDQLCLRCSLDMVGNSGGVHSRLGWLARRVYAVCLTGTFFIGHILQPCRRLIAVELLAWSGMIAVQRQI